MKLTIFLVVFLDLVGFGIIIPILPYLAQSFGANATTLGWLMASYSLMQLLFSPFWGSLSDKYGRRPVLLISIFGGVLATLAMAAADSIPGLFFGRVLAGFFAANISTAMAYIADITPKEDRAKGMGLIGAAFGLGFIYGPVIGGFFSQWGYAVPLLVACGIGVANFIFALITLKEPILDIQSRSQNRSRKLSIVGLKEVFANRYVGGGTILFFLVTLGFTQMEVLFAIFLSNFYSLDAAQTGWLLAYAGLVMVLIQGGLIGKLVKKFGEPKLIILGCTLMAFGLLVMSATPSFVVLMLGLTLIAFGNGTNNPSLSGYVSKSTNANVQGSVLGIYQSAGSLARVLGPVLAGLVYDRVGPRYPFIISAFIMFFSAILMSIISRSNKRGSI